MRGPGCAIRDRETSESRRRTAPTEEPDGAMKYHVKTRINGSPRELLCDADQTLLEVLRDELKLTGSKEGCGTGDCGACTVLLDGALVCSCLVLGPEADGAEIGTVEGVAGPEGLHPVQQQLLEHAGLQCGICTPGIVVAAAKLLEDNRSPSEEEVRYWLAGNLCRCTGYTKIVDAVMAAASEEGEA